MNKSNIPLEIDITEFVNNEDTTEYCNSIANSGLTNIGQITWNNAKNCNFQFVTEENKNEFLNYFLEFGAWEIEELNSIDMLNSLFIQYISGDIQSFKWEEENGIPENERESNIFISDNRFYFPVYH